MLSRCFLDFSVGVGAFVTGLSQISSFFLLISNFKKAYLPGIELSLGPFFKVSTPIH